MKCECEIWKSADERRKMAFGGMKECPYCRKKLRDDDEDSAGMKRLEQEIFGQELRGNV